MKPASLEKQVAKAAPHERVELWSDICRNFTHAYDECRGTARDAATMKVESQQPIEARSRFDAPIRDDRPMSEAIAQRQAWQEALALWLRWNQCYEHVTAQAYASGGDARQLEDLMDEMDQVRQQALNLTQRLLGRDA